MNTPNALTLAALLALVTLFTATPAHAADQNPPGKMTFQGFLTDASTPPVPLGNTSPANTPIIFKIYKSIAGTAAADVLWAESQVVTVDKGHFSVLLGEGSAVSGLPNSNNLSGLFIGADASDRWIGLTVDGAEITPRIQFFPAPYAHLARAANSLVNNQGQATLSVAGGRLEANAELNLNPGPLTVTGNAIVSGSATLGSAIVGGSATMGSATVNGDVTVSGKIVSPKWKITEVMNGVAAAPNTGFTPGLFSKSANFTSSGGTLAIFVSITGFVNSTSYARYEVKLDNEVLGDTQLYCHGGIHFVFLPKTFIKTGASAGSHTLEINNNSIAGGVSGAFIDYNDVLQVIVTEYPF